ncbi:MAG TPA: type IV secretion system DNA-binding domain-containing protein [Tepidisphaeraceae bacterium]|jgi:hypothetical protein|nr:type IV secretion system DNA-binding domain-containing protein [Tepidisphaeraceae bacterium]
MKASSHQNSGFFELGKRAVWGGVIPFGLSQTSLDQHINILGKSGTGKSSLLRNLVLQIIESGGGCLLIDPHGDLAQEVLERFPTKRTDDLIYFNPSDVDYPIAFNVLADVKPEDRARVAAGIVSAFKAVWGDSWGPRLQRLLHFSVATLLENQNISLLGVSRLLTDGIYRERMVRRLSDPVLLSFWRNEYERYDPRFRSEIIDPVLNKLARLAVVPVLRNTLGQVRNRIEPRFFMDHHRVVLANLSIGTLGEDAAMLLGALLVSGFHAAAMGRANQPEQHRQRFAVICDEYPSYAAESMVTILSQARKYKLQLVLAAQHLGLVSDSIRAAVSGNVGTHICFRLGATDATKLAEEFGEVYPPSIFTELNNFELLVKDSTVATASSGSSEPFRGTTLPPGGVPHGRVHQLIRHCRQRYATPRDIVEDRLLRWFKPNP